MSIATIGLDLAKPNFPFVGFNEDFQEVRRRTLTRNQVFRFFERLPPCQIGMELCAGSHYWGRHFHAHGHDVRLIPAHYVATELRDSNKGYFNDARVLAAALRRPSIPNVHVKSIGQQELDTIHRLHSQSIRDRTAHCNLTWKLLIDYGIQLPKGVAALRRHLPGILDDEENCLSERFRRMMAKRLEQLLEMDGHLSFYERELSMSMQDTSSKITSARDEDHFYH